MSHQQKKGGGDGKVLMILVGLLLPLAAGAFEENPHAAAERCRQGHTADCDSNCAICHQVFGISGPLPPGPAEVYSETGGFFGGSVLEEPSQWGDVPLCMGCHPEKGEQSHNHPVGVRYPSEDEEFIPFPIGPKLFCDEQTKECLIFCSSCHDPHHARSRAVRRDGPGSLCQACHRK